MRVLINVLGWIDLHHLKWALSAIDPTHKDVPYIVERINKLEAKK